MADLGLGTIKHKEKNYKEAEKFVLKSINYFTTNEGGIWIADSRRKYAEILVETKRFDEAIQQLDLAKAATPGRLYT